MTPIERKRSDHQRYMKRKREAAAAIKAQGGDQHLSVDLPKPPKPLPVLAAELATLLQARPSNRDIPAITAHARECERLRFWLDLYQWRAA